MKNETKTIHERMAEIKSELSKTEIKKSGHNKFAGFKYHELSDFIQVINNLNLKYGVNDIVNIDEANGVCSITLVNTKDSEDRYTITTPFREAEMLGKGGAKSNVDAVQRMGSTITYNRRYLYMTAYNIQENDGVDSVEPNGSNTKSQAPQQPPKKKLTDTKFNELTLKVESGEKTEEEFRKSFSDSNFIITPEQETILKQAVEAFNLIKK